MIKIDGWMTIPIIFIIIGVVIGLVMTCVFYWVFSHLHIDISWI